MTAASRTLPFGTKVLVKNLQNGRTCEVVINDRGPYVRGRGIDLSKAAAQRLGISGIAKVVCYVGDESPETMVAAVAENDDAKSAEVSTEAPENESIPAASPTESEAVPVSYGTGNIPLSKPESLAKSAVVTRKIVPPVKDPGVAADNSAGQSVVRESIRALYPPAVQSVIRTNKKVASVSKSISTMPQSTKAVARKRLLTAQPKVAIAGKKSTIVAQVGKTKRRQAVIAHHPSHTNSRYRQTPPKRYMASRRGGLSKIGLTASRLTKMLVRIGKGVTGEVLAAL